MIQPLTSRSHIFIIFFSFFITNIQALPQETTQRTHANYLNTIFSNENLRTTFGLFLDDVLRQVSSDRFYSIVDEILKENKPHNDHDFYEKILSCADKVKHFLPAYPKLKLLQHQKTVLSKQAGQILDNTTINGCVEIGTPGTYLASMQTFLNINGPIYAINDKQKWQDHVQSFSFNPKKKFLFFDQFVPLNNYDAIKSKDIPSNSVDLVVCFIGLHHVPQEKLDSFINSIYRILRPGGIFLLRDHDVQTSELMAITQTAHAIFNALFAQESVEAEMNEYRNFKPLTYWINVLRQHGFTPGSERLLQENDPTMNTMLKFTKTCTPEDIALGQVFDDVVNQEGYQRDAIQTYLSSPEWVNVDTSHEYANFIEHTPFYEYPYFSDIQTFWQVFLQSYKTAAQKRGHLKALSSSYTLMNLFIGVSMTFEYSAKGMISWPIKKMYSGQESLIIKMIIKDPLNKVSTIDNRIKIEKTYENGIKLIAIPRYKKFVEIIQKLVQNQIAILQIAGQEEIQYKVRYKVSNDNNNSSNSKDIDTLFDVEGCIKEYEWRLAARPEYIYAAITVNIHNMQEIMRYLEKKNVEILYIHDF
ncbi:MAG: class I SAM-dependent methyltransferase [Candidatus Babeliales bacterium]